MVPTCSQWGIEAWNISTFMTSNRVCAIFNASLALPTILLNFLVMAAILTSNLKAEPCYQLLLNLASTDLLAGLFLMPNNVIMFERIAEGRDPCEFAIYTIPFGFLLAFASFFAITMIAVERYICVFHPYFQRSSINAKTIKIAVLCSWVVSACFVTPLFIPSSSPALELSSLFVAVIGTSANVYCYLKILLQARAVRLQIVQDAARFSQRRIASKDKNLLFVGGMIVVSLSICYSLVVANNLLDVLGIDDRTLRYFKCWEWTLVAGNSLINPVISCVFNPPLRRVIVKLIKCRSQNRIALEMINSRDQTIT